MVDLFTSQEAYKFKSFVIAHIKTIVCITVALLAYSAFKDIIYRFAPNHQFAFKCLIAFILLFFISQF